MKNKGLVIGAFVLVVALLSVAAYKFLGKNGSEKTSSQVLVNTDGSSTSTSLKELLLGGTSQTCTFSSDSVNGTVYVTKDKIRGDFETSQNGKAMSSHMIVAGSTNYIWTDGQNNGFKMAFDPNATTETETNKPEAFDLTANNNYKCSSWSTDNSKFDLPTGVTFSTFALPMTDPKQTPTGSTNSTTGSDSQCSYCNALSGDDKSQCLKALNCN